MKKNSMRVNGYIRVSSAGQSKDGVSLSMQGSKISSYCELNGLELVSIYFDAGISAKNIHQRPGFQEALGTVYSGKVDGLVVWKLDRAFRSTRDALATAEKLNKLGRDFVSISERIDTTSAVGRLFYTLMSAFGQFERDVTSERTVAVLQQKISGGEKVGGFTPFGFGFKEVPRLNKKPLKVLVPDVIEQEIIARIRELKIKDYSFREIARELNREGRKTKTGAPWSHRQVARLYRRAA